jgi:hypothetical protein
LPLGSPKKKKKKTKKTGGGVAVQKPAFNIYTTMLVLSLVAVTTACVLLWLELGTYGEWPQWRAR